MRPGQEAPDDPFGRTRASDDMQASMRPGQEAPDDCDCIAHAVAKGELQ